MTLIDTSNARFPSNNTAPFPVFFAAQVWDLRQTKLVDMGAKPLLLGEYGRQQEEMRT